MFCYKCGNNLIAGAAFCVQCGADLTGVLADIPEALQLQQAQSVSAANTQRNTTVPEPATTNPQKQDLSPQKRTSHKGKYIGIGAGATAIILFVAFILMNTAGVIQLIQKKATFESPGYSTPEKAVTAYAEALKNMDMPGMVSTFAIESYVDNYDFVRGLEIYPYHWFSYQTLAAPSSNEFSYSANVSRRLGEVCSKQYTTFYELSRSGHVSFRDGYTEESELVPEGLSYRQYARFLENYTLEKQLQLENMEITDIILPDGFMRFARKHNLESLFESYNDNDWWRQEIVERWRLVYSADETMDIIVVLEINSEEYIMMPTVIRYGEKWWILDDRGYLYNYISDGYIRHNILSIDEVLKKAEENPGNTGA